MPYGSWSNHSAEDLMTALKLAGCSVRQVAELTGFSREWVRRRLKSRGVLTTSKAPTARVRTRADGSVQWGYSVFLVGVGEPAFSTTILGIPALRGMLLELGMFGPDAPRPVRDSSADFAAPKGDPRPSIAKLMSPDGWVITPDECVAALGVWGAGEGVAGLLETMQGVLAAGGWDTGKLEVAGRTREFLAFVDVLQQGADADGLLVA